MRIIDSTTTDVVPLLSEQEGAIASLYSEFGATLPEMKQFWGSLVVQEKAHAEVLKMLIRSLEGGDIYLDTGRFKAAAIQTNINTIRNWTAKTAAEGITPISALALASDIEHSLIESEYFRVIMFRVPSVRIEIEEIERHTEQHIDMVEKHLNEFRNINKAMVV